MQFAVDTLGDDLFVEEPIVHSDLAALRAIHDRLNAAVDQAPRQSVRPLGVSTTLPAPRTVDTSFTALVRARRSRYDFDASGELSLQSIGTLLGTALGLSRRVDAYGDPEHPLSLAPTAGGLRTREAFLFATRITGLRPGIYAYDMDEHCLHLVHDEDPAAALKEVYVQPEFATLPAASIALTARLDVALTKYPPRHYRTVHVDAGIAVQNLYLTATGLSLACCAVSGFSDPAVEAALALGEGGIATMMVALGPPRMKAPVKISQ